MTYVNDGVSEPGFIRDPEEIRADMQEISRKIGEINDKLNARELVCSLISYDAEKSLPEAAERLSELLSAAGEALDELRALEASLEALKGEFIDSLYNHKSTL